MALPLQISRWIKDPFPGLSHWVGCLLAMGWMCLLALPQLRHNLPRAGMAWLIAGGIIYSLGAIVFTTNRPNLWPKHFIAHDLWHVMVLLGSACHFILILAFLS